MSELPKDLNRVTFTHQLAHATNTGKRTWENRKQLLLGTVYNDRSSRLRSHQFVELTNHVDQRAEQTNAIELRSAPNQREDWSREKKRFLRFFILLFAVTHSFMGLSKNKCFLRKNNY